MPSLTLTNGNDAETFSIGDWTVYGLDGNDQLYFEEGNLEVYLGSGDDYYYSNENAISYINAGDGNDTINPVMQYGIGNVPVTVDLGEGNNWIGWDNNLGGSTVTAGAGNDTIIMGAGNNNIQAGDGDNWVELREPTGTTNHDDTVTTGSGNDTLYVGAGNDLLYVGAGAAYVSGGDGDKLLDAAGATGKVIAGFGNGTHNIITSAYDDLIVLGDGDGTIITSDGNDSLSVGTGVHNIDLGSGDDYFTCPETASVNLSAGDGNDYINPIMTYGMGNLFVSVDLGEGNNWIGWDNNLGGSAVTAGAGNDTIIMGAGNNNIQAGDGDNWVELREPTATTNHDDTITAGPGNDSVFAGSGSDFIDVGIGVNAVSVSDDVQNDIFVFDAGADASSVTTVYGLSVGATIDVIGGTATAAIGVGGYVVITGSGGAVYNFANIADTSLISMI